MKTSAIRTMDETTREHTAASSPPAEAEVLSWLASLVPNDTGPVVVDDDDFDDSKPTAVLSGTDVLIQPAEQPAEESSAVTVTSTTKEVLNHNDHQHADVFVSNLSSNLHTNPLLQLGNGLDEDDDDTVTGNTTKTIGLLFVLGAQITFIMWILFLIGVWYLSPPDTFESPQGTMEQKSHIVVVIVLVAVNGSRIFPFILTSGGSSSSSSSSSTSRNKNKTTTGEVVTNSIVLWQSGFMRATLSVQCIAILSNLLMIVIPTPVMYDPMSGLHFHLIRWVEWIPLTFLMTFLTSNMNAPLLRTNSITTTTTTTTTKEVSSSATSAATPPPLQNSKHNIINYCSYPILLASSTTAGLILPFCPNPMIWWSVLMVSWLLFMSLFILLYNRASCYFQMKKLANMPSVMSSSNPSPLSTPSYNTEHLMIAQCSYILCIVCTITWTFLAATFTFLCLTTKYATPNSILANPAMPTISMCIFEIFSKVWYLSVLTDAYTRIFDERSRAVRRLERLRSFMGAVWQSSSDVMIFCLPKLHGTVINVHISPALLRMVGMGSGHMPILNRGDVSVVLEINVKDQSFVEFAMDLSCPVTGDDATRLTKTRKMERHYIGRRQKESLSPWQSNLVAIAQLAILVTDRSDSKRQNAECTVTQDLIAVHLDGSQSKLHCEARVAYLEGSSCLVVLRDMTNRLRRFETETKLVKESTGRRKDQEANRFTRHEVKNGILEAMSILDQIREAVHGEEAIVSVQSAASCNGYSATRENSANGTLLHIPSDDSDVRDNQGHSYVSELDTILRDVLDSILDDAMGREIINGEYQPRNDITNVCQVLASLQKNLSHRLPTVVFPDPFPLLITDRQLLRCIYRNALSNACRYGQVGGEVTTFIEYDDKSHQLCVQVVNLPGFGHSKLVELPSDKVSHVFFPNTQLSENNPEDDSSARTSSSGNGAWIMQTCARYLNGECQIRFEEERTVFSFSGQALVFHSEPNRKQESSHDVCIPKETWGVIVDKSPIQRKLMDRFLRNAGIEKSRRIILGSTPKEIQSAQSFITSLLQNNESHRVLFITEEILNLGNEGRLSGSKIVESLRSDLDTATEARLLALIRSTNDSTADIAVYKERAHGFLPKEPVCGKDSVVELLMPLWNLRFNSDGTSHKVQASVFGNRTA